MRRPNERSKNRRPAETMKWNDQMRVQNKTTERNNRTRRKNEMTGWEMKLALNDHATERCSLKCELEFKNENVSNVTVKISEHGHNPIRPDDELLAMTIERFKIEHKQFKPNGKVCLPHHFKVQNSNRKFWFRISQNLESWRLSDDREERSLETGLFFASSSAIHRTAMTNRKWSYKHFGRLSSWTLGVELPDEFKVSDWELGFTMWIDWFSDLTVGALKWPSRQFGYLWRPSCAFSSLEKAPSHSSDWLSFKSEFTMFTRAAKYHPNFDTKLFKIEFSTWALQPDRPIIVGVCYWNYEWFHSPIASSAFGHNAIAMRQSCLDPSHLDQVASELWC